MGRITARIGVYILEYMNSFFEAVEILQNAQVEDIYKLFDEISLFDPPKIGPKKNFDTRCRKNPFSRWFKILDRVRPNQPEPVAYPMLICCLSSGGTR